LSVQRPPLGLNNFASEECQITFTEKDLHYQGDCVRAQGSIEISAEKRPYINIDDLYFCESWMDGSNFWQEQLEKPQ
jgi:hypothetical protein